MQIITTDNNIGERTKSVFDRASISPLFRFADKPLSELCRENENLLIFPYSLEGAEDGIGQSSIFSLVSTPDPDKVILRTGNVMGFIGIGDIKIKIQSRFDSDSDDFFLHYMLQRVMHFNIFDLWHNHEKDEVFDFVQFMFPYFLKNAVRQGVYREYQRFEHNDANVRGVINVSTHLRRNMPFAGKIAYTTREHSRDNGLTQLVRHTIEYMSVRTFGHALLNIDSETKDAVELITAHTPSYNKAERNGIIQKNLRAKVHPYYTAYSPLRILCLQILRAEEVKYGEQDDELSGILFDGAWLWEEYVNTILAKEGFQHPENITGNGARYLFKDINSNGRTIWSGRRFPDFYNDKIVLDAKYKQLGSYERVSKVDRNDIHQVISYMEMLGLSKGGFIAPLNGRQSYIPTSHLANADYASLSIVGVEISQKKPYKAFSEDMQTKEREFIENISHIANDKS